jgi:hypothetical protein
MNSNNINIGPSTLDFLYEKRTTLTEAISQLQSELVGVEVAINALKGIKVPKEEPVKDLSIKPNLFAGSVEKTDGEDSLITMHEWRRFIISTLSSQMRPMNNRELILQIFPGKTEEELKPLLQKGRGALNYLHSRENPSIIAYKGESDKQYLYCLPEWFEEDGSLQTKYLEKIKTPA